MVDGQIHDDELLVLSFELPHHRAARGRSGVLEFLRNYKPVDCYDPSPVSEPPKSATRFDYLARVQ